MLIQLLRSNPINSEQRCEVGVAWRRPSHGRPTPLDVAAVHCQHARLIGFHYARRSRRTASVSVPAQHLWAQHEPVLFSSLLKIHQI